MQQASFTSEDSMVPRNFRIRRIVGETADTFSFELESADGRAGMPFSPGQFNMVYIFGVGEVPVSISGDPAKPHPLIHTIRVAGPITKAMRALKRGETIGIRGPFGTGWPVESAQGKDVIVVAGGIGLAPLRSVVYRIIQERGKYGRVILLYGTRTPEDICYGRDIEKWRGRLDLDVLVTVDRAAPSWRGNVGVVTKLLSRTQFDPSLTTAFVCGPEVMTRFTTLELEVRGVPAASIYVSLERNMKCGIGLCGHCQLGPYFVCKDGPVFRLDKIRPLLALREI